MTTTDTPVKPHPDWLKIFLRRRLELAAWNGLSHCGITVRVLWIEFNILWYHGWRKR